MVGYNDTYNRALTARSNALQRRKGQMIDRLNGSGRGDEEEDDDYLSEDDEGMEGGGAYEDDYEDEMIGGSFEEASREVGGAMTYGGRSSAGAMTIGVGRTSGGRPTGGVAPLLLAAAPAIAAAAAPIIGSLVNKLIGWFGGSRGYSGGKRQVKAQMLRDLKMAMKGVRGSARLLPKMRDLAFDVGTGAMKDARYRDAMSASGMAHGGRNSGGFNPMFAMNPLLAMMAPQLGRGLGGMLGLGRNSPIMRGEGFFDKLWNDLKQIPSQVVQTFRPVAEFLKPYAGEAAEFAKKELLPIAVDAGKAALKAKITGALTPAAPAAVKGKGMAYGGRSSAGRKCCSACMGSGMTIGVGHSVGVGRKKSPYELAYGGNQFQAQDAFDRDDERIAGEVRGLRDAERRNKEARYALGAGGKRLYMKGGVGGQLAPMGQESMFGYDNDEQGNGLIPPRNVATRGYLTGCGAMPMYSCGGRNLKSGYALGTPDAMEGEGMAYGGRQLTPVDNMKSNIGGRASAGRQTGGRPASAWIAHVKSYASKHGVSYKEALSKASATYR
jgi:hypothetical protein